MTEERDKLLARIRKLLAMTAAAGCTEAEALAAAEKVHELIETYQIDLGAEEIKREGFVRKCIKLDPTQFTFARRILLAIEEFCEVRHWYTTFGGPQIEILGLRSDAEFAAYLIETLTNFAIAGADMHIAVARKMALAVGEPLTAVESREANRSYLVGCASRIAHRLHELAAQRKAQAATPGSSRALVCLDKPALIAAEMERLDIKVCGGSGLTGAGNQGSFAAGAAHGAKATFGRPVSGGGGIAGMIGRRSK
jgi:Protein of unknown function (DUF2786)